MRTIRFVLAAVAALAMHARTAHAGGQEMPDLGASALGRGAAFTARADDGMALLYNVGGFAQQRGTNIMLSLNVIARSYTYTRPGNYPDKANDPLTPWGGKPFPVVESQGKPATIPTLVVSSDFGVDRLSIFGGILTPSPAGGGTFPIGVADGVPNPARYQSVATNGLVVFPTLGVSYRVTDWLDLGVGGHLVYGSVDAYNVSILDSSPKTCPNTEYQPCDVVQHINAHGVTAAASLGALLHPTDAFSVGLNVRSPFAVKMDGDVTITPPKTVPSNEETDAIQLTLRFPWVVRAGARYASMKGKEEQWDAELDVVYETWSSASITTAFVPKASFFTNVDASIDNGYTDCSSFRLGGSYHVSHELALRTGAFYETSSTPDWQTRAGAAGGFSKLGLTLGGGYDFGPVKLNAAYAAVLSPDREVTEGRVYPGNAARGGTPFDSSDNGGKKYPATNLGTHSTHAHVLSLSVAVAFGK